MKRYVCHKEVKAALVRSIMVWEPPGEAVALTVDGESIPITTGLYERWLKDWRERGPTAGPFGGAYYLVRYADGYLSFSPAKAFEEGYTELGAAHDKAFAETAAERATLWKDDEQLLHEVQDAVGEVLRERWEYVSGDALTSDNLRLLGEGGWEAFAVSDGVLGLRYHFKRRLP